MNRIRLSDETIVKVLQMASEIASMNGQVIGNRICQDWTGSKSTHPDRVFTDAEREKLHFNYELMNSNLRDYDESKVSMGDEMLASFIIANELDEIVKDMQHALKHPKSPL